MSRARVAVVIFLVTYGLLSVPWLFWPLGHAALGLLMFGLYLLLALGLAADLTEVILALRWPGRAPPRPTPRRWRVRIRRMTRSSAATG